VSAPVVAERGPARTGTAGPAAPQGIRVRDLAYAFGARVALDGVDVDVRPGVITGLLGPNGAGKTTFMRILLGVLAPHRGTVLVGGRPLARADRVRWGYMPQQRGLYPAMKAGDQVVHFARLHGLSRREAAAQARDLLARLGLVDRWADRTDRLSGGMQQQLQLATALVHAPEVVVLDEPFSGLDPSSVALLSELLRERATAGCTVLFSSHQLDLVQHLCEEIVMVDDGRVVLAGEVADLRARGDLTAIRVSIVPVEDLPDEPPAAVAASGAASAPVEIGTIAVLTS